MKKQTLVAGGLAVTMAFALSACGGQKTEEKPAAAETTAQAAGAASEEGSKEFFPLSDSVTITIAGTRDDSETQLGE